MLEKHKQTATRKGTKLQKKQLWRAKSQGRVGGHRGPTPREPGWADTRASSIRRAMHLLPVEAWRRVINTPQKSGCTDSRKRSARLYSARGSPHTALGSLHTCSVPGWGRPRSYWGSALQRNRQFFPCPLPDTINLGPGCPHCRKENPLDFPYVTGSSPQKHWGGCNTNNVSGIQNVARRAVSV